MDMIERLKVAIEGECEGLAITDDQARSILEHVLGDKVRHKKRGATYNVLGEGEVQISTDAALKPVGLGLVRQRSIVEGDKLTVYRSTKEGKLWIRFPDEFADGRFEPVE